MLLAPIIAAIFCFLPAQWLLIFLALASIFAFHEMASLAGLKFKPLICLLAVLNFIPLYLRLEGLFIIWLCASCLVYILARLLTGGGKQEGINEELLKGIMVLLCGQVFITLPFFTIYLTKGRGQFLPFILLLALWASDIGAFTAGKNFGKRPLAPRISPKKTYEGLLGAVLGSAIIITAFYWLLDFSIMKSILTGAVMGILGQTGDLLESAAKRISNAKDSSMLIPGHGGILDRMDSFIFAAPFFYICLIWKV